jgi:acyl carrier protein
MPLTDGKNLCRNANNHGGQRRLPIRQQEYFDLIHDYFHKEFEVPAEKIKPEANLFEDLELDSIDALDMIGMLEAKYDIEVDEDEVKSIRTVQDVVDYLTRKIP